MSTSDILQIIAILVGAGSVWFQLRREWLLHSAEMVTSLLETWQSADYAARRGRFAKELEQGISTGVYSISPHYGHGVLGFYEHLALLTRKRAVDFDMIWNKFYWEAMAYFHIIGVRHAWLKDERVEHGDPATYEEMEWLYQRFVRHGQKKGLTISTPRTTSSGLRHF